MHSTVIYQGLNIMDNVFTAVQPFCTFLSAIGLFPLTFSDTPQNGKFGIKWQSVVASCCNVMVLMTLLVLNSINAHSHEFHLISPLLNAVWRIQAVFGIFLNFVQLSYQIRKRKNIVAILTALNSFDKKVSMS